MKSLEERVASIEKRNTRVELDKAWETSWTRKIGILVLTYVLMTVYMKLLGVQDFVKQAIIPTLGFFLSTLTLGWIKQLWLKLHKR